MKITAHILILALLLPNFTFLEAANRSLASKRLVRAGTRKPASSNRKTTPPKKPKTENPQENQKPKQKDKKVPEFFSTPEKRTPQSDDSDSDAVVKIKKPEFKIPVIGGSVSQSKNGGSIPGETSGPNSVEEPPGRNPPPKAAGKSSGPASKGESYGLWWPVCVFVDGPDANAQIAEMVRISAACRVNLVPFVRPVSIPNPNDPEAINSAQSSSCNMKEAGYASKGSSLVLTIQNDTVADKMCKSRDEKGKPTTEVAGCNEVANGADGASKSDAERAEKDAGHGFGGFAKGDVAVGIVDAGGYSSGAIYSHETMGHGQMGWPNGELAGNGIGKPGEGAEKQRRSQGFSGLTTAAAKGKHNHNGAYTALGCDRMRQSALVDENRVHKFYPDKERYYIHNTTALKPLGQEKIWKNFKDGPESKDFAKNASAPPRSTSPDAPQSASRSNPKIADSGGSRHKKRKIYANSSPSRSGGSIRTGDAGASSGPTQRGDDSPDQGGVAVGGGTGGAANNATTITANILESSLNYTNNGNPNGNAGSGSGSAGNSSIDPESSFFFNGGSGESGVGGRDSFSSVASDNEGDPDFFSDEQSNVEPQSIRKPRLRKSRSGYLIKGKCASFAF